MAEEGGADNENHTDGREALCKREDRERGGNRKARVQAKAERCCVSCVSWAKLKPQEGHSPSAQYGMRACAALLSGAERVRDAACRWDWQVTQHVHSKLVVVQSSQEAAHLYSTATNRNTTDSTISAPLRGTGARSDVGAPGSVLRRM